ncbi:MULTISPECIES: hypothetical protein [unclassified Pseudomonas]|uniref:hypothetical protein n=1 Tax=unclassified Pseudomonas TaxID=196821 RepID=UPI00126838B2|nr:MULTISPECIES: hypothetical protein [unclassified Pseudomonas]
MSKLACTCGHIIRDQTDSLSYKASLIKDQQEEEFIQNLAQEINSLLTAAKAGNLEAHLDERYGNTPWRPKTAEVCYDIIGSALLSNSIMAYECQLCGKLWVQKEVNSFMPFNPESGVYEAVLSVNPAPN